MAWVERAKQVGMSLPDIGRVLGIPQHRFAYWREREVDKQPHALVPVEVTEDPPAIGTFVEVSVVSPSGFRVDGLTLEQAIEMMKALR